MKKVGGYFAALQLFGSSDEVYPRRNLRCMMFLTGTHSVFG